MLTIQFSSTDSHILKYKIGATTGLFWEEVPATKTVWVVFWPHTFTVSLCAVVDVYAPMFGFKADHILEVSVVRVWYLTDGAQLNCQMLI